MDRRCFIHDFLPIFYDMEVDFHHGLGYPDEDMDWEMPDPYSGMHFKIKRSPVVMFLGTVISLAVLIAYPIFGLKMPQRDHPFFWRKKFSLGDSIQVQMSHALIEWGGTQSEMQHDTACYYGPDGFKQNGPGLRFDIASYRDLII